MSLARWFGREPSKEEADAFDKLVTEHAQHILTMLARNPQSAAYFRAAMPDQEWIPTESLLDDIKVTR